VNELRRAIPFLLLTILLLAAGCQLLPPNFLVPASPSPAPVAQATAEPTPESTPLVLETPSPSPIDSSPSPSQPAPEPQTVAQLRDRAAAWEANEIVHYDWQILLTCYCAPHDWVDVSVIDGKVDHARDANHEPLPQDALEQHVLTVDAQFDAMLEAALKGGAVEAAFGRFGQPITIRLDPVANAYDDELTIVSQQFLPAQGNALPTKRKLAILEQRAAWQAAGIDDYAWRVQLSCFCLPLEPLDVEVVDGEVASVRSLDGAPGDATSSPALTVDDVFVKMLATIDNGGIVQAEYGSFGEPLSVTLDASLNGDDDELYIESSRFTPSP
jgi:hypothetical protein